MILNSYHQPKPQTPTPAQYPQQSKVKITANNTSNTSQAMKTFSTMLSSFPSSARTRPSAPSFSGSNNTQFQSGELNSSFSSQTNNSSFNHFNEQQLYSNRTVVIELNKSSKNNAESHHYSSRPTSTSNQRSKLQQPPSFRKESQQNIAIAAQSQSNSNQQPLKQRNNNFLHNRTPVAVLDLRKRTTVHQIQNTQQQQQQQVRPTSQLSRSNSIEFQQQSQHTQLLNSSQLIQQQSIQSPKHQVSSTQFPPTTIQKKQPPQQLSHRPQILQLNNIESSQSTYGLPHCSIGLTSNSTTAPAISTNILPNRQPSISSSRRDSLSRPLHSEHSMNQQQIYPSNQHHHSFQQLLSPSKLNPIDFNQKYYLQTIPISSATTQHSRQSSTNHNHSNQYARQNSHYLQTSTNNNNNNSIMTMINSSSNSNNNPNNCTLNNVIQVEQPINSNRIVRQQYHQQSSFSSSSSFSENLPPEKQAIATAGIPLQNDQTKSQKMIVKQQHIQPILPQLPSVIPQQISNINSLLQPLEQQLPLKQLIVNSTPRSGVHALSTMPFREAGGNQFFTSTNTIISPEIVTYPEPRLSTLPNMQQNQQQSHQQLPPHPNIYKPILTLPNENSNIEQKKQNILQNPATVISTTQPSFKSAAQQLENKVEILPKKRQNQHKQPSFSMNSLEKPQIDLLLPLCQQVIQTDQSPPDLSPTFRSISPSRRTVTQPTEINNQHQFRPTSYSSILISRQELTKMMKEELKLRPLEVKPVKQSNAINPLKSNHPNNNEKMNNMVFYPLQCVYEGEYDESTSTRCGHGKFTFHNGYSCEGTWVDDVLNGSAIIMTASRIVIFEGDISDGQFQGKAIYHEINANLYPTTVPAAQAAKVKDDQKDDSNARWDLNIIKSQEVRYEGEFKNGLRHGSGILSFSDHSQYYGEFFLDQIHGIGTFKFENSALNGSPSEVVHGQWNQGVLEKPLVL